MSWIELSCQVCQTDVSAISEALESHGALSVSYFDAGNMPLLEPKPGTTPLWQKVKVVGLFDGQCDVHCIQQTLTKDFLELETSIQPLADQEWTRTWLEHFKPMPFGSSLWVIPYQQHEDTQTYPSDAKIVKLDPGLAFGTGTHPTTALCLRYLADYPMDNLQVIDYGCGSGILGIAALKLGASKVMAIDYDPQALTSTLENAARNDLNRSQLQCFLPDQFTNNEQKVDIILANILAEPLILLAERLAHHCRPNGRIVLSGLLEKQITAVKAAYLPWFCFDHQSIEQEWVCLSAYKVSS